MFRNYCSICCQFSDRFHERILTPMFGEFSGGIPERILTPRFGEFSDGFYERILTPRFGEFSDGFHERILTVRLSEFLGEFLTVKLIVLNCQRWAELHDSEWYIKCNSDL